MGATFPPRPPPPAHWISDYEYTVTVHGHSHFKELGIDTAGFQGNRPHTRPCLDWTERKTMSPEPWEQHWARSSLNANGSHGAQPDEDSLSMSTRLGTTRTA
jgi:hypothetical protein